MTAVVKNLMQDWYKQMFFSIMPQIDGECMADANAHKSYKKFTNGPFDIEVVITDRRKGVSPMPEGTESNG